MVLFLCNFDNKSAEKNELIWSFLAKCDIMDIDTGELSEYIEMTKKEKHEKAILQEHIENFYHIWENNKGVYLSYLPAPGKPKNRKSVSASTLEKLERKIIDFYLNKEKLEQENDRKINKKIQGG